jgi:hypothetical protein
MKTSKLLVGFGRLSDENLETKALAIAEAMKDNANFCNPSPDLDVLNAAIKNYSAALKEAQTRNKVKVMVKNSTRKLLEDVLLSLGSYVSFIANGDRVIQASSGFSLNTEIATPKTLGPVENFSVQTGKHSGQAHLSVNPVKNALSYVFLYAEAPVLTDAWMHTASGSSNMLIDKLSMGTAYSFRIGITGSKGQLVYTEIITKMIV